MPSWPGEGNISFSVVEEDAWCLFRVAVSVFVHVSIIIIIIIIRVSVPQCHSVAVCAGYLRRAVSEKLCLKIRFGRTAERGAAATGGWLHCTGGWLDVAVCCPSALSESVTEQSIVTL
jgi:hypothetical protein